MKKCKKCGEDKPLEDYYRHKNTKDGRFGHCKKCHSEQTNEWRRKNPGPGREYSKRWRRENLDRVKKNQKEYCKKNRSRIREREREYYRKNREKIQRRGWARLILSTYGVTEEQYFSMLEAQGGGCAICGASKCKSGKRLSVDHCHRTGKVRGILCQNCNKGIGNLQDDPTILRKAAEYIERHEE